MKETTIMILILIGLISLVAYIDNAKEPYFTVNIFEKEGAFTNEQSIYRSTIFTPQSIIEIKNKEYSLQSNIPLPDQLFMKFETSIENPAIKGLTITNEKITHEGITISDKKLNNHIPPHSEEKISTNEIFIQATKSNVNHVVITYEFNYQGETFSNDYQYQFYQLEECNKESDCGKGNSCDLNNIARLSSNGERYCAKTCNDNSQCPGDICIKGFCGFTK